jgi:hypothetical protein
LLRAIRERQRDAKDRLSHRQDLLVNGPSKMLLESFRRSFGVSRACILLRTNALRRIGHGDCAKQDASRKIFPYFKIQAMEVENVYRVY